MRKVLALTMFLGALAVNAFAIGEARLTGKIVDAKGNPVADATIEVTATGGKTFNESFKTDKNGKFTIFLLDGTLHYKMVFKKDGVGAYEEVIKLKLLPERNERTITLAAGQAVAGSGMVLAEAKADPAVAAYNEAAAMANEGKVPEAIAKMKEAVAAKPDLTAGWMALAKLEARAENWPGAIEAANKVLEISPDEPEMFAILAEGYDKTGDKAKAKEFKEKAPANPTALFNEAARLINAGNDKEAEPLLKKALGADPEFAQASYELGMIYARMGKNPEAKANLEKYLSLEPNGKDAALAKEMLKYVQ